jgi:hypothetical protein
VAYLSSKQTQALYYGTNLKGPGLTQAAKQTQQALYNGTNLKYPHLTQAGSGDLGQNLGPNTRSPDILCGSSQSLHANAITVP